MTRNEILDKLKEVFSYTAANALDYLPTVTEDSNLYTDLGLSSVGMLYIVISTEELFKITFDNVNFEDFRTVGDVVTYIERKVA